MGGSPADHVTTHEKPEILMCRHCGGAHEKRLHSCPYCGLEKWVKRMKTDKIQLTIPNKLYGDKVVTAYACNGLAVAKVGKTWTVYHVISGATVNGRYQVTTRKEALGAMQKLIELVRWSRVWEKPSGHRDMRNLFSERLDDIRAILS